MCGKVRINSEANKEKGGRPPRSGREKAGHEKYCEVEKSTRAAEVLIVAQSVAASFHEISSEQPFDDFMNSFTCRRASFLLRAQVGATTAAAAATPPVHNRPAMAAARLYYQPWTAVSSPCSPFSPMATCTTSSSAILASSHSPGSNSAISAAQCERTVKSSILQRDGWVRGWDKKLRGRLFSQAAMQAPLIEKIKTRRSAVPSAVATAVQVGGLTITRDDVVKEDDPTNNVPDSVFSKLGLQLHNRENHPLGILKNEIHGFFDQKFQGVFEKFDNLSPIVSVKANFDDVLVPEDHVSRKYNDTYYINSDTVLRCHTSAHQAEKLREGHTHFLVAGDVYRRDAIDATHYPVFHQMEGFRVFNQSEWEAAGMDGTSFAAKDLKETLEGLAERLFGKVEMRWIDTYFPFTDPSFELEIYYQDKWLEVLGCGVVEQEILDKNGCSGTKAWAFGLGLERLAMVLFGIPDIRLFWSDDTRFTSQFTAGQLHNKFKSFSKFPPCYKDISFWISDIFSENNLCELVRGVAGDLVEEVILIDEFTNPKKGKTSHCYRITYRSMERSLTDEEINDYQTKVREQVESKLKVTLR